MTKRTWGGGATVYRALSEESELRIVTSKRRARAAKTEPNTEPNTEANTEANTKANTKANTEANTKANGHAEEQSHRARDSRPVPTTLNPPRPHDKQIQGDRKSEQKNVR